MRYNGAKRNWFVIRKTEKTKDNSEVSRLIIWWEKMEALFSRCKNSESYRTVGVLLVNN